MPYLRTLLVGPEAWEREDTLSRAIEIRDGVVQNPKILSLPGTREGLPSRSALSHQSAGDHATPRVRGIRAPTSFSRLIVRVHGPRPRAAPFAVQPPETVRLPYMP